MINLLAFLFGFLIMFCYDKFFKIERNEKGDFVIYWGRKK